MRPGHARSPRCLLPRTAARAPAASGPAWPETRPDTRVYRYTRSIRSVDTTGAPQLERRQRLLAVARPALFVQACMSRPALRLRKPRWHGPTRLQAPENPTLWCPCSATSRIQAYCGYNAHLSLECGTPLMPSSVSPLVSLWSIIEDSTRRRSEGAHKRCEVTLRIPKLGTDHGSLRAHHRHHCAHGKRKRLGLAMLDHHHIGCKLSPAELA